MELIRLTLQDQTSVADASGILKSIDDIAKVVTWYGLNSGYESETDFPIRPPLRWYLAQGLNVRSVRTGSLVFDLVSQVDGLTFGAMVIHHTFLILDRMVIRREYHKDKQSAEIERLKIDNRIALECHESDMENQKVSRTKERSQISSTRGKADSSAIRSILSPGDEKVSIQGFASDEQIRREIVKVLEEMSLTMEKKTPVDSSITVPSRRNTAITTAAKASRKIQSIQRKSGAIIKVEEIHED